MTKRVDPISFFIKVRGQEIEVTLDPWISDDSATASFRARTGGKDFRDDTLEGLRKKLMAATRSDNVKVKVPFSRLDAIRGIGYSHKGWSVRTGVITGIHGGSGNLMARWDDTGKAEQLESTNRWNGRDLMRPMSKAETHDLIELQNQSDKVTRELAELKGKLAFDAKAHVQALIDRKLDGEDEGDHEPDWDEIERT